MIQAASECLEPELLRDVLQGRLPHERFAAAIEHLDQCSECTEAIERLNEREPNEADSIVRQLRSAPPPDPWLAEPDCQSAMLRLLSQSPFPQTTASDALPLSRIGPYRLIGHLGRGGMGTVYLAEHDRLKRTAAIKLLPRQRIKQPGWLERFDREMTAVASLEHPHVVRALDAGEEAGWHYLVMEHLEGLDLSRVTRRLQDVSVGAVCELMRQAALGLAAVHEIGMVHRDVKPSNLFLTNSGMLKLLDLGLVLADEELLASDDRLTTVGHLMGTVPYMAPEQLADSRKVDFRADLYGLGATMHRLLTGRTPHASAGNLASTIRAVSEGQCPSIATQRHDLPPELVTLVDELLGYDPQQRPGSAMEVARRLEAFAEADAPREVIRRALACDEQADEQASAVAGVTQTDPRAVYGKPPRSRWRWVGLALVPLAFLAGIVITLSTDRGTLVIESDVPGVEVSVFQGEEKVTDLRLETQESTVKLFSGPYEVRLKNTQADGFHIENERVVLTRGDEQVVRIRHEPKAVAATTPGDPSQPSFQGKPLDHWLRILRNEQDPATLGTALQAAGLLARGDERVEAAKAALVPARRLGGMTSSRPNRNSKFAVEENPSYHFMHELNNWYPAFFPEPGLEAIATELREGNQKSAMACAWLLMNFRNGYFGAVDAPAGAGKGVDFYRQQASTPSRRDLLERLGSAVEFRVGELNVEMGERVQASDANRDLSLALGNLIQQALLLNKVLGTDVDPVIANVLHRELEEQKRIPTAKQDETPKPPGMGGLGITAEAWKPPFSPIKLWGLSQSLEPDQIPAGVFVPSLMIRSHGLDSEEAVRLYRKLSDSREREAAVAMVQWLGDWRPMRWSNESPLNSIVMEVFQVASNDLVENSPEPALASTALAQFWLWSSPAMDDWGGTAGPAALIQEIAKDTIAQIGLRILRKESDLTDTAHALRSLVVFGEDMPEDRRSEVAKLALQTSRQWGDLGYNVADAQTLKQYLRVAGTGTESDFEAKWAEPDFLRGYLVALFEQLSPELATSAIATELREGNVASTLSSLQILRNHLAAALHERSAQAGREPDAKVAVFRQWIESDEGKETLQELADALTVAFGRLQESEHPSRNIALQMTWEVKLHLLHRLEKEPAEDPQLVDYLRQQVARRLAAEGDDPVMIESPLSPTQVGLLGELDGWDAVPAEIMLDPLFREEWAGSNVSALDVLQRIAEARPEVLANQTAQRLMRAAGLATKGERYFKPEFFFLKRREEEWKWLLRHLGEHAAEVEGIDRSRLAELSNLDPPTDDWKLAILHAMNDLANAGSGSDDESMPGQR